MAKSKYQLIAMLLQPKGNYSQEECPMEYAYYNAVEMAYDCGHIDIAEKILSKFAVDSDHFMHFESSEDFYVNADKDGFYLFKRISESRENINKEEIREIVKEYLKEELRVYVDESRSPYYHVNVYLGKEVISDDSFFVSQ